MNTNASQNQAQKPQFEALSDTYPHSQGAVDLSRPAKQKSNLDLYVGRLLQATNDPPALQSQKSWPVT